MKQGSSASRRTRMAGFTLIEMLVAIALLAVIALLSWRGLSATVRGRDDLVSNLTQTRVLGRYFSQLQFDMLNLVTPDEVFGPPLRILPDELVLVRHVGVGQEPATLQVVRYRLKDHQLLRSASPPLATLSALTDALHHMDEFASLTASNDVHSMRMSVWLPPSGWTDKQEDLADAYARFLAAHGVATTTALGMPLPTGIRLSITLGAADNEYVRTIPIAQ